VRIVKRGAAHALVLLAAMAAALTACGSSSAASPCWKQVQDDWTNHTLGDHTYAASCYDLAIKNLPPDLRSYSDAPDQILAAKQKALRAKPRRLQFLSAGGSGSSDGGGGTSATSNTGGGSSSSGTGGGASPLGTVLNAGSGSSDSMPLPILILGALAILLIAGGAVGVANRHLHARQPGGDEPPT